MFDSVYSAWFMYERFVYIKNHEIDVVDNHLKHYEAVWDKTFSYVYDHQEELIKKYNIIGVYYGNHSFTLSDGRVI